MLERAGELLDLRARGPGPRRIAAGRRREAFEERVARLERGAEAARLPRVVGEEGERDELRRERLRRGDADLRARVRREDAVDEARDGRPGDVHDADGRRPEPLRLGARRRCRPSRPTARCRRRGSAARRSASGSGTPRRSRPRPGCARPPRGGTCRRAPACQLVPHATTRIRSTSARSRAGTPIASSLKRPVSSESLLPDRLDDDRRLLGDLLRHEVGVAPLLGRRPRPRSRGATGARPRRARRSRSPRSRVAVTRAKSPSSRKTRSRV